MKMNKITYMKNTVIASRRRSNPLSALLLSLLLALSLVSCVNNIPPDEEADNTTSSEPGIAYITLGEPNFGNNSRTIIPNNSLDYSSSNLTNLVFTAQKTDGAGNNVGSAITLASADAFNGLSGKKIPIEPGTYNLKLIATLSGAPMEDTIENQVISNGTNSRITFNLKAPSNFLWGGCNLHLKFDNTGNKVSKVVVTLKWGNSSGTVIDTKEFTSSDFVTVNSSTKQIDYMRQVADESQRLHYGFYYITFDFYKTYDAPDNRSDLLNSICEYMYIDQGHWTTWTSSVYNINDVYTIDYKYYVDDAEDSTYTPASALVLPGAYSSRSEELEIPALEKEGYTFLGWYTDNTFTTRLAENDSHQQIIAAGSTGSKELYARFIKPELYVSSSATDDTGTGFTEAAAFKTFGAAISKINTFTTPFDWTIHIIGEVDMGTDDYKISNFYPEKLILAGKDDGTSKLKATSDNQNSVLWINDEDLEVEITNLTLTGCLKDVTQITLGGGITIEKGTCTLSDGAIVTGNTAANGDGIYVKPYGGILKIKGTAKVASDDTIYYYSNDSIIISDSLTGTYTDPVATIELQNYNRTSAIVSAGTSELLAASYNRFLILPKTTEGVTTMYKVGSDGKISSSLAAGDIVFTDQTVMTYTSGLSFSDDAKARAVGVIYNTDYGYIPRGIIGKVNSVNSSLVWCERDTAVTGFPDIVQYELEITDDIATTQIKGTSTGDKDGSSNENTFRNHDSTSTYPAFDYVDNYKTTAGLTGTAYENDWYMPSIVEMLYIAQHVSDINNSLAKIGNQLSGRYWTPSLYADDDNMIWTVVINDCVEQYERNYNAEVCCVHQF